jgi:hypothetical protein
MLRIETRNSTYLVGGEPGDRTVVAVSGTHAGLIIHNAFTAWVDNRFEAEDHKGRLLLRTSPVVAWETVED